MNNREEFVKWMEERIEEKRATARPEALTVMITVAMKERENLTAVEPIALTENEESCLLAAEVAFLLGM